MISKHYSHNTNIQEGVLYDSRTYATVYAQQLDSAIRSCIHNQVLIRRDRKRTNNKSTWVNWIPTNEQHIVKHNDDFLCKIIPFKVIAKNLVTNISTALDGRQTIIPIPTVIIVVI